MMTAFATLFGALPLAVGMGTGLKLRHSRSVSR
jgi:multidrug efflux pump subunit AcrB